LNLEEQYIGFFKSHPLWFNEEFGMKSFDFSGISGIPIPTKISDLNLNPNEVLGKRVEHFFRLALQQSINYHLIAYNEQIFDDKITLGELDFIIFDRRDNRYIHVELVFKFYLYDSSIPEEIDRWIGPNRKDTLPFKLKKLKQKQFPLLYHTASQAILEKHNIPIENISQEACYLAHLFLPFSKPKLIPKKVNSKCVAGYWIAISDFKGEDFTNFKFHLPLKKYWMVDPKLNKEWSSYTTILENINLQIEQKKSPLLWVKNNEDQFFKLFVVWW